MPSESTISKLKSNTEHSVSTREQSIAASHRKAAEYQYSSLRELVAPEDKTLLEQYKDSKFEQTRRQSGLTVATADEIQTTAMNAISMALGVTGDTVKFVYNMLENAPKGVSDTPLPNFDAQLEPFTAEGIASMIGGDPEHYSWIPAALATPGIGPAEIKLGMQAGVRALRPHNVKPLSQDIINRLNDADPYDESIWKETGWYKDESGTPQFWINDNKAIINNDPILKHPFVERAQREAIEDGRKVYDFLEFRAEEILKHDELYAAYPQMRNLKIRIGVTAEPNGQVFLRWRGKDIKALGKMTRDGNEVQELRIFSANLNPKDAKNVVDGKPWPDYRPMDPITGNPWNLRQIILHEMNHAVQSYEGFARGTNVRTFTNEQLDRYTNSQRDLAAVKAIGDKDINNVDELFKELRSRGLSLNDTELAIRSPIVQRYLAAYHNSDIDELIDLEAELGQYIHSAKNQLGYLLEYISGRGSIEGMSEVDLIKLIKNKIGKYDDLNELAYHAYSHTLGEAYSRLVEALSDTDVYRVGRVPNPNDLADVKSGLSIDVPAGTQEVQQFAGRTEADLERLARSRDNMRPTDIVGPESRVEERPVFDRKGEVQSDRGRGGMDGGSLDSGTSPDDAWKTNPEGTQQQGTLEELFPELEGINEGEISRARLQGVRDKLKEDPLLEAIYGPDLDQRISALEEGA